MINTPKEIKEAQLRALVKRFKTVLGFRLSSQSYQLHEVMEVMKKVKIKTDAFSLLIAFDTHCTANVTKYQNYKIRNPLVWFFYFGLEDQPTDTIDFLYRLFFQDNRFLQPTKGIELTIDYEQSGNKNKVHFRDNSLHHSKGRGELGMGCSQTRIVLGADDKRNIGR